MSGLYHGVRPRGVRPHRGAERATGPAGRGPGDLAPANRDAGWRGELAGGADALIVHCGRLSPEKHVERSVDTVAELTESGVAVRLVIAGDGPRRRALERRARGLPMTFLGFLSDRGDVARLLASADISLALTGLLADPEDLRRAAARARAEEFAWPVSVQGMLAALR